MSRDIFILCVSPTPTHGLSDNDWRYFWCHKGRKGCHYHKESTNILHPSHRELPWQRQADLTHDA